MSAPRPDILQPHLHANEQGIKVLFGKRYRWERDTPTSPLRLVTAKSEPEWESVSMNDIAAEYDQKAAASVQ